MDIEAIYAAIVDGSGSGGDLAWTRRRLQHLALDRAKTSDAEGRLGALKVGALLGAKDGLAIAHELVTDPDTHVRTIAFNQVVAAKEMGLASIRKAADGSDRDLATAAFDLLIRWVDVQSLPIARRALSSPDPAIRTRAATLLGHLSSAAATLDLQKIADSDPDDGTRAAATEALRRLRGELPKAIRQPWWDDLAQNEPDMPDGAAKPPPPAQVEAAQPTPESLAAPTTAQPDAEGTRAGETTSEHTALVAPQPAQTAPAPDAQEPVSAQRSNSARLPDEMPTETRALVRLLGMVAQADRGAVLDALKAAPAAPWSDLMLGCQPGGDAALARGLALSAAALGRTSAVRPLTTLLGDPDPTVRVAATTAIGEIGAIGTIPALLRQMSDSAPEVAASAVRALVALALRLDRPDLARDQLARFGGPLPDLVRIALDEATIQLGR